MTELKVASAFIQKGYQVSQPLVTDSRYDFIVDIKGKLLRIQVKTCRVAEDKSYILFATSSSHTNTTRTINHSYTKEEVDFFATIYENQCYIYPVQEAAKREQRLRLTPPLNGNQHKTKYLKDYSLNKFLDTLND